jgi:hypothetical protein
MNVLLPSGTLILRTHLHPDQVVEALSAVTGPWQLITIWPGNTLFQGTIEDSRFCIQRIGYFTSGFRPVLEGTIDPDDGGSLLTVTARLSRNAGFWACIFLPGSILICVPLLVGMFVNNTVTWFGLGIAIGFPVGCYLLIFGSFKIEFVVARTNLLKLLHAEEQAP